MKRFILATFCMIAAVAPAFGQKSSLADLIQRRGLVPAILVPFPFATADHQAENARYFEAGGGAVVVPETELARVPGLIRELLADPARLTMMQAGMLALARPNAADEIAEELIALAR